MKQQTQISEMDLPLCCPLPTTTLWNEHPKVYLPLNDNGEARCPYCSTDYILVESNFDSNLK